MVSENASVRETSPKMPAHRAVPPLFCHLQAQDESRAQPNKAVNDPPHVLLPGGTKMPLLGLGTYKLQSADAVKQALEREHAPMLFKRLFASVRAAQRPEGCCGGGQGQPALLQLPPCPN